MGRVTRKQCQVARMESLPTSSMQQGNLVVGQAWGMLPPAPWGRWGCHWETKIAKEPRGMFVQKGALCLSQGPMLWVQSWAEQLCEANCTGPLTSAPQCGLAHPHPGPGPGLRATSNSLKLPQVPLSVPVVTGTLPLSTKCMAQPDLWPVPSPRRHLPPMWVTGHRKAQKPAERTVGCLALRCIHRAGVVRVLSLLLGYHTACSGTSQKGL